MSCYLLYTPLWTSEKYRSSQEQTPPRFQWLNTAIINLLLTQNLLWVQAILWDSCPSYGGSVSLVPWFLQSGSSSISAEAPVVAMAGAKTMKVLRHTLHAWVCKWITSLPLATHWPNWVWWPPTLHNSECVRVEHDLFMCPTEGKTQCGEY